jgi:hypothetical protein
VRRFGVLFLAVCALAQAPVPQPSDQSILQAHLSGGGYVVLEPRVYTLHAPVTITCAPVRIEGVRGATQLRWSGGDGLVATCPGYYATMPITIRDVTLECAGTCGTALRLAWPSAGSVNEPTAIVESVTIRPHPTAGPGRSWARGVELTNGWYARLTDLVIHGDNHDAEALDTAITLRGWSTGVRIGETLIYGGKTGIYIEATEIGHGEGPTLQRVEMVDVGIGVHAKSTLAGGRPTPMLMMSDSHIAARRVAVMLEGRSEAGLMNNLFYGVPPPGETFVGVYAAAGSDALRMIGNRVSVLVPAAAAYGLILDRSADTIVALNQFAFQPGSSHTVGIWAPNGPSAMARDNIIRHAQWPVIGVQ